MKSIMNFKNFKLNEEVPYNMDLYEPPTKNAFTEEEITNLKEYGADRIDIDTAIFYQKIKNKKFRIVIKKSYESKKNKYDAIFCVHRKDTCFYHLESNVLSKLLYNIGTYLSNEIQMEKHLDDMLYKIKK